MNKKTKIQINSLAGNLLFEHECEDNTQKKTVEKAVKDGANLDGANLDGANLDGANLDGASLIGANLYGASLIGARLDGASLIGANLDGASLIGARLDRANLYGARLDGARLDGAKNIESAYLPIYCKWSITIHGDKIKIGCKETTIPEWDAWFESNEIFETDRNTNDFKRIQANYEAVKTYMLFMDNPIQD